MPAMAVAATVTHQTRVVRMRRVATATANTDSGKWNSGTSKYVDLRATNAAYIKPTTTALDGVAKKMPGPSLSP